MVWFLLPQTLAKDDQIVGFGTNFGVGQIESMENSSGAIGG